MIKGIRQFILYPAIIAIAYWLTDGLIYEGVISSVKMWIALKSIGLLLIPVAALYVIAKKGNLAPREIIILGFYSPVWIWLLSSSYMPLMGALQGKSIDMSIRDFGMMVLWFPIMAIEVSTWSGGLLGLALASISLPIAAIIIAKKKKSSNALLDQTGDRRGAGLR